MLLITIFVELRVVAGRSQTQAGSPQAVSRRPCCAMALRRTAWSQHGMASVNQTWPHFVNQMGKTHSKPLEARHDRGTAWARHAMCDSALTCVWSFRTNSHTPSLQAFPPHPQIPWCSSPSTRTHIFSISLHVTRFQF